jgi:hypothetical protein
MNFAEAETAHQTDAVWLGENIFRAGKQGVDDVVTALKKIQTAVNSDDVKARIQQKMSK